MEAIDEGRNSPARAISDGAVQLLRDYTGRGPNKARTVLNDDMVTIVLVDTLTRGERTLLDRGDEERVMATRREFQRLMRDDLVALVESQVQREVVAFLSANHADPDLAVETFMLAPKAPVA